MIGWILACGSALFLFTRKPNLAAPVEPEPEYEPSHVPTALEVFESWLELAPTTGAFYSIQPGDTPLSVVKRALGADATAENVVDYLRCMSSGPRWNMPLYATPSTSKLYPDRLMVPGKRLGLRVAFLPRNENVRRAVGQGLMPVMTVDPRTGAPADPDATDLGTVWLPPVDEEFSCDFSWDDGSTALDPPPDFLRMLDG